MSATAPVSQGSDPDWSGDLPTPSGMPLSAFFIYCVIDYNVDYPTRDAFLIFEQNIFNHYLSRKPHFLSIGEMWLSTEVYMLLIQKIKLQLPGAKS